MLLRPVRLFRQSIAITSCCLDLIGSACPYWSNAGCVKLTNFLYLRDPAQLPSTQIRLAFFAKL